MKIAIIILIAILFGASIVGIIYLRGIIKMPICRDFEIINIFECAIKASHLKYIKWKNLNVLIVQEIQK